jgi:hypothetical protein
MIGALSRLWRGDLPISDAVWIWGLMVAVPLNLVGSIAMLLLVSIDRPWAGLLVGSIPAVPYTFVCAVGIWRSLARVNNETVRALARAATVLAALLLSAT